MAYIKSIEKIYSDGRHNASTDIEYWNGYYYIVFRNANGHARPGPDEVQGKIFIFRSRDLKEWEFCARIGIGMKGDNGDPTLLPLGDELGVYFVSLFGADPNQAVVYEGGLGAKPDVVQSHMAFTSNGTSWSQPEPVHEFNYVFWRVERFGNDCYAASYGYVENEGTIKIVHSPDGHTWENVASIHPGNFPNETGLWITDDRKMRLISRERTREMSYLSESEPPYKDWKFKELNYTVHCPVIRAVGDELWVAGKTLRTQFPSSVEIPPEPSQEKIASLTRRDERLAKTPEEWYTAIWRLVDDRLEPILVFPSKGDGGYPGLLVEKDRVLMSFYSQLNIDEAPETKPGECPSDIYLAEITL